MLGKGIVFVSQHFREIVAAVALFKAAEIAITYLIDKFYGLDKVMKAIREGISWLWNEFKKLINMLPDSLIPDNWKLKTEQAGEQVDRLANKYMPPVLQIITI